MEKDTYLTIAEVADMLQLSPATVRRLYDAGVLRGFRIPGGNHRRISYASVTSFAASENVSLPEQDQTQ